MQRLGHVGNRKESRKVWSKERSKERGGKKSEVHEENVSWKSVSLSRQSSVKKRRDESEASSICVVDSDTDSGTSKYHPTSSFRLE